VAGNPARILKLLLGKTHSAEGAEEAVIAEPLES
jgi:hypothetical protein